MQGDLAVGVAELGAQVAAVDLGQLQKPVMCRSQRKNGGDGSRTVFVEPLAILEERLLEDVGVVDPARRGGG